MIVLVIAGLTVWFIGNVFVLGLARQSWNFFLKSPDAGAGDLLTWALLAGVGVASMAGLFVVVIRMQPFGPYC